MTMRWILPGTVLEADPDRPAAAEEVFSSLFLGGGLVLSQVCRITGLEPYTVQNWVKRGFLAPPVRKKYNRRQLCRILMINMLKTALPMEAICRLLSYVNGQLNDESDDTIDDSQLYLYFLRLAAGCRLEQPLSRLDRELEAVLADYQEPCAGARDRIAGALRVMVTAYLSSQFQKQAEEQLQELGL